MDKKTTKKLNKKDGRGQKRKYDEATRRAFIECYESGMTVQGAAEQFNIPLPTAYVLLRNENVPLRETAVGKTSHRLTKDEKQALVRDYNAGMRVEDIRRKYGICLKSVYLNVNGEKKRRSGRRLTELERSELVKDYVDGLSCKDICVKYGITFASIYNTLRSREVTYRRKDVDRDTPDGDGHYVYNDRGHRLVKRFATRQERLEYATMRFYKAIMEADKA